LINFLRFYAILSERMVHFMVNKCVDLLTVCMINLLVSTFTERRMDSMMLFWILWYVPMEILNGIQFIPSSLLSGSGTFFEPDL